MRNFSRRTKLVLTGCWLGIFSGFAQTPQLPLTPLPLRDMSAFRQAPAGWSLAGGVNMDLQKPLQAKTSRGEGILVTASTGKEPLRTVFEGTDMLVEIEFMLPKGGQSAVYLQGRYGLLFNDSWGQPRATANDCGALEGRAGATGLAPRQNVCRAPGLWQTLTVDFRGPRFDGQGRKIQNARLLKVLLNGVAIHENIELAGPTAGAPFRDEKATGPLVLDGKGKPVAFRNIGYEIYETQPVTLTNLQYQLFEGKYKDIPEMKGKSATKKGSADGLTWETGPGSGDYALTYTGNLSVPKTGKYSFAIQCNGAAQLLIDNKDVITLNGENGRHKTATGTTDLTAGNHSFTLTYAKNHWRGPVLGVFMGGQGMKPIALHSARSFPDAQPVGSILVESAQEPTILRSFLQYGDKKRTHCLSVGDPSGTHYSVDLNQGALLQAWKGGFLNTTQMWHERGEPQLAFPTGSLIPLSGQFPLARLDNDRAGWPDSVNWEKELVYKGYKLDPQGRPLFRYDYQGVKVTDQITPEDNGRQLSRTMQLEGSDGKNLYFRLAAGKILSSVGNGLYAVNDNTYLVRLDEKKTGKPAIREVGGQKELILPIKGGNQTVAYSIIW